MLCQPSMQFVVQYMSSSHIPAFPLSVANHLRGDCLIIKIHLPSCSAPLWPCLHHFQARQAEADKSAQKKGGGGQKTTLFVTRNIVFVTEGSHLGQLSLQSLRSISLARCCFRKRLRICCVFSSKKNLGGLQLQLTILHQFDSFSVHLDHLIKLHEHDQGKKIQNGSESHGLDSLCSTRVIAKKFANLWVVVLSNIQCCGRSLVSD